MVDLDDAVEQWRTEGWTLLEGLLPRAEVDRAVAEIEGRDLDPPRRGPLRRPDEPVDDGGPAFRDDQFSGTVLFPVPGAPHLNRLFVHPALVAFARRALGTDGVRIYQSRLWSKYGDRTNYEQPLHRDRNHSLVPTRSEPGWWFMECFLYLTDVGPTNGAPRLVPLSGTEDVAAPGPAGSLLAYRSDVLHRGTDLEPGTQRHVLVVAFKPTGLDWIGFDAHPPLVINVDFVEFVNRSTPEELELFGVPPPGHPYWTAETIAAMAELYPELDLGPWSAQMPTAHPSARGSDPAA